MKLRIALVEYLNTWPFSKGITLSGLDQKFDFFHVPPAQCAELFRRGEVDISLCPVGALSGLPSHEVVGKYCIGADGPVETVMLLSKVPLAEITSVCLDDHSRTSNQLVQILARDLWDTDWDFYFSEEGDADTCLMIGDKVFAHRDRYPFHYDLASAWKSLTGLPMVFAVWVARPGIPREVMEALDDACSVGLQLLVMDEHQLEPWQFKYLTEKISYPMDDRKQIALKHFLKQSASLRVPLPQKQS